MLTQPEKLRVHARRLAMMDQEWADCEGWFIGMCVDETDHLLRLIDILKEGEAQKIRALSDDDLDAVRILAHAALLEVSGRIEAKELEGTENV